MKYNSIFLNLLLGIAIPTCSLGQFDSMVFFDTIESSQIDVALYPLPLDLFIHLCAEVTVVSLRQPMPEFLGHRVLVYGRHFGALRALIYALKHPQNVVGLILESPVLPVNNGMESEILRLNLAAANTLRTFGIDGWSDLQGYCLPDFSDKDFWQCLLALPSQLPIEVISNTTLFPGCVQNCKDIYLTYRGYGRHATIGLCENTQLVELNELTWLLEKVTLYLPTISENSDLYTPISWMPISIPLRRTGSSSPISMRSIPSRTSSNTTPPTPDFVQGDTQSGRPRSWSSAGQAFSGVGFSSERCSPYFARAQHFYEKTCAHKEAEQRRKMAQQQRAMQQQEEKRQAEMEASQRDFAQLFAGKKKKSRRRALTDAEFQQKSILYPNDAQ